MKLKDFLFCEDVRNEIHGKLSLMGLYDDRITIRPLPEQTISWPIPLSLAIILRFQISSKDEKPDSFELEFFMNEKLIIKIPGKVNINSPEQTNFNLTVKGQGIPVELGELGFTIKLSKNSKVLFSESHKDALEILQGKPIQLLQPS